MSDLAVRPTGLHTSPARSGPPPAPAPAAVDPVTGPAAPAPLKAAERAKPSLGSTFSALRHRDFAVMMLSALVHMLAIQMGMVASGYLAYELSGSATVLGLMGLAWGVPMLTLSLIGGVIADRVPRRTILMVTQGTIGCGALVQAILIYSGLIQLWHMFAVALVQGTCFAFNMPARQALAADMVGQDDLPNAIALNNANMNLTRVLGPALAGFLIATPAVGIAGIYGLMAAAYVFVIVTMSFVNAGRHRASNSRRSGREQLVEGLKFIRGSRQLVVLLTLGFVPMLLGMHYQMLMPVFALGLLRVGPEGLGMLSMAAGIGALIGSLALAVIGNVSYKRRLQTFLGIGFGLSLFAFALASSFWLALLILPIVGATSAAYQSLNNTLVMENTPREFYGRVMSVYMMTFSLMPLATVPVARLADLIGARPTVAASGALLAYVVAVIAFGATAKFRVPGRAAGRGLKRRLSNQAAVGRW